MATKTYPYTPTYAVPPGWVLREDLEAMGLSCADFARQSGLPPELVGEILVGNALIDLAIARKFGKVFGKSQGIWLRMEASFRRKLAEFHENAELSQWAGSSR